MAKKILSENAQAVLSYIQAHKGETMTAKTIAAATGLTPAQANGTLTGLQRKGLTIRVPQEEGDKTIELTADGAAFDVAAEVEE